MQTLTTEPRLKVGAATWLLITSMLVLPAYGFYLGFNMLAPSSAELIQLGAQIAPITLDTQPWRMLSAMFLHSGLPHLVANAFGLMLLGSLVESNTSKFSLYAVFLITGFCGNLLGGYLYSLNAPEVLQVSVGASGGVMGLLGFLTLTSTSKHYKGNLGLKELLWLAALTAVLGALVPNIDNAAHLGGYLAGLCLSPLYFLSRLFKN